MKTLYFTSFAGAVTCYTMLVAINLLAGLVAGALGTYLMIWAAERTKG